LRPEVLPSSALASSSKGTPNKRRKVLAVSPGSVGRARSAARYQKVSQRQVTAETGVCYRFVHRPAHRLRLDGKNVKVRRTREDLLAYGNACEINHMAAIPPPWFTHVLEEAARH